MKNMTLPRVSIIMPAYNCQSFIAETIESVMAQTYTHWELIVVDDCSTDGTRDVISAYAQKEPRIKFYPLEQNGGAAHARNTAVDYAQGKYLAFLDSDDLWVADKLEKQIAFMEQNGYLFTCTNYLKIDEQGNSLNKTIRVSPVRDYDGVLKTCPGNSTVIYDAEKLGKCKTPKMKNREDYAMWLSVVKKAKYLYGMDETLGCHRIRQGSLSSKKFQLVRYHWMIYRQMEHLSWMYSVYLLTYWIFATVLRLR